VFTVTRHTCNNSELDSQCQALYAPTRWDLWLFHVNACSQHLCLNVG